MAPELNEFAELTPDERNLCDHFQLLLDQRVRAVPVLPRGAVHWLSSPASLTYEMIRELRQRYLDRGWSGVEIVPTSERTYQVTLRR